ncbi:hypothetical protein [Burkholderia pseudomallei]|uniref:hypothetical protein n=1 Tax=Burkholderia pseudomallei TaxID=28450 RepID=UPI0015531CC4|nr:hypothetical protein [Burkholderia pseudomallei]
MKYLYIVRNEGYDDASELRRPTQMDTEVRSPCDLAVGGSARWLISVRRRLGQRGSIRFANLELSKKCIDTYFGEVLNGGVCDVGLTQRAAP